ncbi:MAG: aldo/keto reductase [Phycisphaerae bacterium]
MEYRKLGKTDISVSAVCMGGWAIVTEDFNWGSQDVADSIAAVHASLDAGVNFFDTAEAYGAGESEEILARALDKRRKDVIIASKVGADNLSEDKLRASCDASLRRLKTDYIDLYQIHWPSPKIPIADTLAVLARLQKAGKIRAVGVSNFGPEYLVELVEAARAAGVVIASNQLPYSLLWRPIEVEIQPLCTEHGIGILCYSPLCQGILTGKFATADEVPATRARMRLFAKSRPHTRHGEAGAERQTFDAVAELRKVCKAAGVPMGRAALAWLLAQNAVVSVIAGARNAAQAKENASAAELKLPADVLAKLSAATEKVKAAMGQNADPWQHESRMVRPKK